MVILQYRQLYPITWLYIAIQADVLIYMVIFFAITIYRIIDYTYRVQPYRYIQKLNTLASNKIGV